MRHLGGNPFRGGHKTSQKAGKLVFETRQLLASLVGVGDPNKLSFTYNATYALNMLLKGFLRAGDHVITSSYDNNSVIRPLQHLKKESGISYDVWNCDQQGKFTLSTLEKLVTPQTKLLIFTHASNVIGALLPLQEVCHFAKKRNITLALDCTQTVGHLDLELEKWGIDMAAGTCHKALLGPSGLGFLYVRDSDRVRSCIQGGGGFLASSLDHPEVCPAKYEAGTINYIGIAGLHKSLEWLISRKSRLRKKTHYLYTLLKEEMIKIPHITLYGIEQDIGVPILSCNVKGVPASQVETFLEEKHGIIVRAGLHCAPLMHEALGTMPSGTVRISLGPFNQERDIRKIVHALTEVNLES